MAKNVRINSKNGEFDYYFPLEITDSSVKEYAMMHDLEIGQARLGFRRFEAVFVPCKDWVYDTKGRVVYLDTPSEVQHRRYLDLIKDEMNQQEDVKQDGRCQVSDGKGSTKRCPLRIPNPDYALGKDKPKTIPVRCEGCAYEPFRQAHTIITVSSLERENDDGETDGYIIQAPASYYAADQYLKLRRDFMAFVGKHEPKLAPLAELLMDEYSKSESARKLGKATSTIGSQAEKLKELMAKFLDNVIAF